MGGPISPFVTVLVLTRLGANSALQCLPRVAGEQFADNSIYSRDAGCYLNMVISQRLCLLLYPASCLPLLVASR